MKLLAVAGILWFLLFKVAVLMAILAALGLGIAIGAISVLVGVDVIRKEEELQR